MPRLTRSTAVIAGVVAAGLAVPAAAQAGYTGAVNGNTVTLTGDQAADTLTIAAANGLLTQAVGAGAPSTDFDSATAGVQSVPADGTANLVINAADGDDIVTVNLQNNAANADLNSLVLDGGAGDDLLTGTAKVDTVRGGDGDDRLVAGRNNDTVAGGAGDDVLVWNNGDNSDQMDGEDGQDEVEVNGAPNAGDVFTTRPGDGQRVRFDRTNLVPFTLDIGTTERLALNGLGGADQMTGDAGLAARILLFMTGGAGADALTGGDGPDAIAGGPGADTLDGAAGDDRVAGDRGADTMRGSVGDDTLVWNNGDGSDTDDGGDGADTMEVNGAQGGADQFTLAAQNGRAIFDRVNLVPFKLSIGGTELLDVRGLAGDDSFTPSGATAAVMSRLVVEGGSGADTLSGSDSIDVLSGGTGNDTITGAGALDTLDAGDGDDRLFARDAAADLVTGGAGADTAQTDPLGIDTVDGVETIDRAAPADTVATPAEIRTSRATINRRGVVALRVSCPGGETGGCAGALTLTTAKAVKIGRVRATVVLGSARVSLAAGQTRTVRVRLAAGHRALAKKGRIAAVARVASADAAGNRAEATRRVALVLPKRR